MKEKDEILAKTDGGLDIFVHYLGKECLRKKFRSHMREDDKHPSCKLYRNQALDGRSYYYLHDFGDSRFSGDCFFVASQVLNINPSTDFVHLLKMIDQDMCLGVFDRQTNRKAVRQASPMSGMKSPDEENRQPLPIKRRSRNFLTKSLHIGLLMVSLKILLTVFGLGA